ncbi:MAG: chemotaxis protein CheA [Kofleriaceae bacterium]
MLAAGYLQTFVDEARELLERIEAGSLALEARPDDREVVHQLFRAFHTLKGSAGVAGVAAIASFTHHVETAMDHVREGRVAVTPALISVVLSAKDHVAALLDAALGGGAVDPTAEPALIGRLAGIAALAGTGAPAVAPVAAPREITDFLITFRPIRTLEVEPADLLDELRTLGQLVVLAGPEAPIWQLLLTTERDERAVRDAFLFVDGSGELEVEAGLRELIADEPGSQPPPGPVAARTIDPSPEATAAPAASPARAAARTDATVRVSSERLDQLVKLIGELVINQSRLHQAAGAHPSAELAGPVEAMARLIGDVRDNVLGLRMVPIGTTFTRYQRLVRDLCGELDKSVELVTEGDDTELDKTVIDQLGDALVHVLRNSMDHGVERPDERVAAGKPARGTIRLAAAHEGTHVVITISDDGRGIDTAAVRRKAEAQGLIQPGELLSEQEAIALVLRPGFSTAAAVTQVSGRGVGMDAVKRTVEGLRGTMSIASERGAGTRIRLTLPLTLAIIDGLLVEIDRDRFVVPMAAVTENLELGRTERAANNRRNLIAVRGELVPYIRLREVFAMPETTDDYEKIVVVSVEGERVGLVVDRVIGSHQTVIQPLGRFYRGVDMFSGTTILGDGRVAMILDLPGTVRTGARHQEAS